LEDSGEQLEADAQNGELSETIEQPKKRPCLRFSKDQTAVLEREFESGILRKSAQIIASEIDQKPAGIGSIVTPDDVKAWMHRKAAAVRKQQRADQVLGGAAGS